MEQIEEILNEKWKDRWYRSLEATFDNSSLLPEIRPSWITPILSDSQKAALVTRDPQTRFGSPQVSQDSPMLPIDQRFQVGATTSSESIEIESGAKKASPVDGIIERAKAKDEEGQVDAKKP